MTSPREPSDSVLQRIEGFAQSHHESGYEQGYVDAYRHVRKILARRSLAYVLIGLCLGASIIFLLAMRGVIGAPAKPVDPKDLGLERGLRFQHAADFAMSYTVGIAVQLRGKPPRLGSGFIFNNSGHVVTNYHVVEDWESFTIYWNDREYSAYYVGGRPDADIAVLRFRAFGAEGGRLMKGPEDWGYAEEVLAIGSPLGFRQTVTSGIISHPGRLIHDETAIPYIQTDCAINSGNSGGPLVNLQGRVLGMNRLIYSSSGEWSGIGFAIPIHIVASEASRIIEQSEELVEQPRSEDWPMDDQGESLTVPDLGVTVDKPRSLRFGRVVLSKVAPYSAAESAGIEAGDVITHVGRAKTNTKSELERQLNRFSPGDKVAIRILRGGAERTLQVTIGSWERNRE